MGAGGDKLVRDNRGRDALAVAEEQARHEIAGFLRRWTRIGLSVAEREDLTRADPPPPA